MLSTSVRLSLVLAVAALAFQADAHACSCLPPDMARSFDGADAVFTARIDASIGSPSPFQLRYSATVTEVFKGCLDPGDQVVIQTASSSAACGIGLGVGQSYYLNGYAVGAGGGLPVLGVGLCDTNKLASQLTAADRAFLDSQPGGCGETKPCPEGLVQCFVDPCQVSSCDVPGAKCVSNYCGGCFAEWYDVAGNRVCVDEGCSSDDDCSFGSWCRGADEYRSECVPFAEPGEACGGEGPEAQRCQPALICVPDDPEYGSAGTCAACSFDGEPYQVGDTFPAGDGCNTCFCSNEGFVGCTLILCPPQCDYEDPDRGYVSRDPKVCARISIHCLPGFRRFDDDCGCGCEPLGASQEAAAD